MAVTPNDILFAQSDLDDEKAARFAENALLDTDDGEIYFELSQSESFLLDDNRLKHANYDVGQGFGLRAVCGEATGYAHSAEFTPDALDRAAAAVAPVRAGYSGVTGEAPKGTNRHLYTADNPLNEIEFDQKVKLLEAMNAHARSLDSRVRQVSCSLAGSWNAITIVRGDGQVIRDIRPLVRLNVSVVVDDGTRQESGSAGTGGRTGYTHLFEPATWQDQIGKALDQALINLDAVPAPAGEMTVVLGPGWPGILLHEAIGHGLEGDFNRKKTSAFAGLMGQRVASPGVTVIDDGTIPDRRGSLTVDDEGTPTSSTVLIEDGILKGYMQDRLNARLMGMAPTGNGRRESFACQPMPRMTNTYMLGGDKDPEEILKSVDKGLYAVSFGGGQVDITNGKFTFSCTEAYMIENGKIGAPVKGATLIGNGPDCLTHVTMIGNDMMLDPGIGTCGKNGQGVPVGVGQPTLRLDGGITVGGTATG